MNTFHHTKLQNPKFDAVKITTREREVLQLVAYEHSTKEIADKLYVSYETALSHRKNIMHKLRVKNAAGMVRVAFERGLMNLPISQAS